MYLTYEKFFLSIQDRHTQSQKRFYTNFPMAEALLFAMRLSYKVLSLQ